MTPAIPPRIGRILRVLRLGVLCAVVSFAALKFARVVHEHYPIQDWLFWRYASHWLLASALGFACFSAGSGLLGLLRIGLPRAERTLMSFALGFYTLFLLMFVGGLLHLFGHVFAIVMPMLLAGIGLPRALRRFGKLRRPLLRALRAPVRLSSPWSVAVALFGVGGFLLVYIPTLTPQNIAADTRWYHLVIAENYAAAGGIIRSAEGSFNAAYPHLASVIYTWAFILPRTSLFDRIEIAAQIEVMVFVWTLLGVAVLAARVIPQRKIGLLWTSMFLFPGLFLYDSSLSVAADHVLAFWGPPIVVALLRVFPDFEPKRCLLLGAMLAGAALTKYQAGCLVLLPAMAFALAALWRLIRGSTARARLRVLAGTATATFSTLLLSAPHWAKNAIWYHDPFYPLLHDRFAARPWSEDASVYYDTIFRAEFWRPAEGPLRDRLKETVLALWSFSFEPHDWSTFHGSVPVFGSLFTLTTLCLPFVGRARRLWLLYVCTYGGVAIWYWGSHQDRYLQALVPLMAAATGAMLVRIWRSGLAARIAVTPLVALQIIWGGDVPFIPTHVFIGTTPFKTVIDLMATGYKQDYVERLRPFPPWLELGHQLPKNAKVLIHGDIGPLGLGRMTVGDIVGWQGGISYGRYASPAAMRDALAGMGVTHILWVPNWGLGWNSLADDLVFNSFVNLHAGEVQEVAKHKFVILPTGPLPNDEQHFVLVWGKVEGYAPGLYPLRALTLPGRRGPVPWTYPKPLQPAHSNEAELARHADYAVVASGQHAALPDFVQVMTRAGKIQLWARPTSAPAALPP